MPDESSDVLEETLLEVFDVATALKGRSAFAQGAVREFVANDEILTALVDGSRREPYVVTVPVDPDDGLPDAIAGDCTCAMGSLCKHMAAALIAYAHGSGGSVRSPGRDRGSLPVAARTPATSDAQRERTAALYQLDLVLDRSKPGRESVISVEGPGGVSSSAWAARYLRMPAARAQPAQRWRLVFAVGIGSVPGPDFQGRGELDVEAPHAVPRRAVREEDRRGRQGGAVAA